MATFSRNVTVNWEGSIMEGKGTAKAGSGAFNLPVSFPRRIGDAEGVTSPEELIAGRARRVFRDGAQRLCRPQGRLDREDRRDRHRHRRQGRRRHHDHRSKLSVTAHGLTGIPKEQFAEVAREAEGKCPVSNALRGSLKIEVDAKAV